MASTDHFREAEQLLAQAAEATPELAPDLIARAQVHATLALAASNTTFASAAGPEPEWMKHIRRAAISAAPAGDEPEWTGDEPEWMERIRRGASRAVRTDQDPQPDF